MRRAAKVDRNQPECRLRKKDWLVCKTTIPEARALIVQHHYAAGASNTATALHGLYRLSDHHLSGVAWWIPPTRSAAVAWNPSAPGEVLALSRLAIEPDVPKNAATFLLMNSVKLLDSRWPYLVTYADTWRGHTGHIYRAAGWEYCGLTKPERTYIKDGRMISRKAGPKTRTHAEMLALGAECIGSFAKHRFRLIRKKIRSASLFTQLNLATAGESL
jgi:hypothetical protein